MMKVKEEIPVLLLHTLGYKFPVIYFLLHEHLNCKL